MMDFAKAIDFVVGIMYIFKLVMTMIENNRK